MSDKIEVFMELRLRGPDPQRTALRKALAERASPPWSFDRDRTDEMVRNAFSTKDLLVFERAQQDMVPAAFLTLWAADDGYYVSNIVPIEVGELSRRQYNAILKEFAERVVGPVAADQGFVLETSSAHEGIEDWLPKPAANALVSFSRCANKSTRASHPHDQRRWFDFIIEVHRSGASLGPDRLARWLHQVEGWDEDSAHDLAGDFETSLALLERAKL